MKIFFMHKKVEHKHTDTHENDTTDYSVYYACYYIVITVIVTRNALSVMVH